MVALLQRGDGAALAELVSATGWLPHTTRAALTGLRKRGYAVGIDTQLWWEVLYVSTTLTSLRNARDRYVLTGAGRRRLSARSRAPGTVVSFRKRGVMSSGAPYRKPASQLQNYLERLS